MGNGNKKMKTVIVIVVWLLIVNSLVSCSAANAVGTRVGAEAVQTSQASPAISDVSSHLTSDDWGHSDGEGPFTTTFLYTFAGDGTYSLQILTDVTTDPEKGEWRLTSDDEGHVHLILRNRTGKYYWLPQDCIIRYDKSTDSMLVSGGQFRGTQKLEKMVQNKPGK
jgi:hypothetical protein